MKILVTGSNGFIGRNLVVTLRENDYEVFTHDRNNTLQELEENIKQSDFVVHLAGVNRSSDSDDFYVGNVDLTKTILDFLKKHNDIPLLISSSIQSGNETVYGQSKKEAEAIVSDYEKSYIFRLHNVYGKWSRPNYNSVIATWCHNIARDLPIQINDPDVGIGFVYIDDVIKTILKAIQGNLEYGYQEVKPVDIVKLGEVKALIESFRESRKDLSFPNLSTRFSKNLYSTYLSYIPIDNLKYELTMHEDNRGSFTEVLKSIDLGQISINISKPNITKGQHWHHSKNEKFLVVSGQGKIEIRHIITNEKYVYHVSGDKLEVVDIPTGYTHNIINTGDIDMVTLMWANEVFDPKNPDTYHLEV